MQNHTLSYKIKDRVTGLYRKADGKWSKNGKTWSNLGYLKNHFNCHGLKDITKIPPNWEIIVLIEVPCTNILAAGIHTLDKETILKLALEN